MPVRILLFLASSLMPLTAPAEVAFAAAEAMQIKHQFRIEAPAARAWESLIHPERWWPTDHTWSGKRESLSLRAEASGCYCENWSSGSAEHGRVVMVIPGQVLRLDAALGPFLDMAISGDPAHKLDGLAPIVNEVLAMQFGAFAEHAGKP